MHNKFVFFAWMCACMYRCHFNLINNSRFAILFGALDYFCPLPFGFGPPFCGFFRLDQNFSIFQIAWDRICWLFLVKIIRCVQYGWYGFCFGRDECNEHNDVTNVLQDCFLVSRSLISWNMVGRIIKNSNSSCVNIGCTRKHVHGHEKFTNFHAQNIDIS